MESQGTAGKVNASKVLAIIGVIVQVVIYLIVGMAMYRVYRAMQEAGLTELPQVTSQEEMLRLLSPEVLEFLHNCAFWNSVLEIISWVCIGTALFGYQYRATWFFWAICLFALLWMTAHFTGLLLGGFVLIWTIVHRQEFFTDNRLSTVES